MPEVDQYLHALADDIGPRPATTDAEAAAADYLEDVMRARGLDVERQEFECPRTYSWAYVLYNALTITAAVASGWPRLLWPSFAVSALVALLMWMDLDLRWGLTSLMPKGPSQNVIARYTPRSRRGEKTRRVILVAHYDSARASLAFAPSMVRNIELTFLLLKTCTFLVPAAVLVRALPQVSQYAPWDWYATMALSAYLLLPLLINVHRELFMKATDGANDNASGVAAMLGVMDALVPEREAPDLGATQPIRRAPKTTSQPEEAQETGLLEYAPAGAPEADVTQLPEDFEWAEPTKASSDQSSFEFDTIEFDELSTSRKRKPAPSGDWADVVDEGIAAEPPAMAPVEEESSGEAGPAQEKSRRRGLWSRSRGDREGGVSSWLGLGRDFDARDEGRKIGSWDKLDDDDGFGDKGGWAGDDPIGDPDFAATEASRIRKRVTESIDRALSEKEVWFVATGAEEAGSYGMRAFLDANAEDVKSAAIINLDNIGAGTLHWVTAEGMVRRYRADRRLLSVARKVSRESEILVKGREYKGLSTDGTVALRDRLKAMSIMAFDINGRLPNWHWRTDTSDSVQIENIEKAKKFVVGIIREL
ncbi:MAG: M28 family metallopeptidase [Coriobacteriia bacterium]|nr:M28 family metallopeptidase [Coriobacteriia bacterium]